MKRNHITDGLTVIALISVFSLVRAEQPGETNPDSYLTKTKSNVKSVSPDKQWEFKCTVFADYECVLEIVKAGTNEVVLDLTDLTTGSESGQAQVVWAPDSKRFAFIHSPVHAHHTVYETVAFYQLQNGKWEGLDSPSDFTGERVQLAQLGQGKLPKNVNPSHCARDWDVVRAQSWTDANTVILYAPCHERGLDNIKAAFLFTLKFDGAGRWKVTKTQQMTKKGD